MKKIISILPFVALILFSSALLAQTYTVTGYITDKANGESMPNAGIYEVEAKRGTAANNSGFYSLRLRNGNVNITYSYIGYLSQTIQINLTKDTVINVALTQDNSLSEIVVTAKREDLNLRSSQMSAIEVPLEQVKSMPALFGEADVLKAIQLLPGVQSASEGNVGLYIRGGNYDQNMITLDGATIYNPEHLKGFISAFNTDILKKVVLYKGGFPAQYGGRLSGIVDVSVSDGNNETYHGSATIGVLSAKLHAEGPIVRGKTTFNFSGRVSYFDAIAEPVLRSIYDSKNTLSQYSNMNYYDVTAKVTHKFNNNNRVSATFYIGQDKVKDSPSSSHQNSKQIVTDDLGTYEALLSNSESYSTNNKWGNNILSLHWESALTNKLFMNVFATYSSYKYKLRNTSNSSKLSSKSDNIADTLSYSYENSYAQYNSGIEDYSANLDFEYLPNHWNKIKAGAKFSSQEFIQTADMYKFTSYLNKRHTPPIKTVNIIDTLLGNKKCLKTVAFYIDDDINISERLKINAGLRYSMYMAGDKNYSFIEPRVSARLMLMDGLSFKASYSVMSQGIYLLSSSNLTTPSDLWVSATENIEPMKSNQYAAGLFYEFKNIFDFSIEGYYKTMDKVLDYKEGVSYMTAKDDWEGLVAVGKGWSYGIEFLLQKKVGRTTGWLSYTWSKAYRQYDKAGNIINGGDKFYANNDCRNNISLTISHKFNKHWELSGTFVYHTGKHGILTTDAMYSGSPTRYDSYYKVTDGSIHTGHISYTDDPVTDIKSIYRYFTYRERNGYKLPDYHRLDLSLSYMIAHKIGESIVNLSIYNIYNRMNISNIYIGYDNNKSVLKGVCIFPFMPSISYTYQF